MFDTKPLHTVIEFIHLGGLGMPRTVAVVGTDAAVQLPPADILEMVGFPLTDTAAGKGGGNGHALLQRLL